ncbi:Membrane transport protein [Musa troglodytarum]|uniref:Membrane transport protein n=1 Tax=Musa troglodytarum TaxID=320322 RepID=A0A9E7I7J4_9LILI|nr:Membrane transport protein [Musa troglodytarum]
MGLWSLLLAASTPVVQVLLMGLLGAYLASGYSNILLPGARRDMNKVVFTVFTPALLFANLAKTVTFQEIISWWFMPVNIGITFLIGGILGWIVVKILRPPNHIEGLVIAACSAGNLGNLLLIIIPAICEEDGNPFGNYKICSARGISYVSFSMAVKSSDSALYSSVSLSITLGAFYIWTHSYSLMRNAGKMYHATQTASLGVTGANEDGHGVSMGQESKLSPSVKAVEEMAQHQVQKLSRIIMMQEIPLLSGGNLHDKTVTLWDKTKETLHKIVEELLAPPTAAAIVGFVVGAVPWLKSLFIGSSAPLKVVQDSMKLLGDGTVPCITLILGGNLTQGLRKSVIRPVLIVAIVCVRYVILPAFGIAVVQAAYRLGFVPYDPLYRYVLMVQFGLPPAMSIGKKAPSLFSSTSFVERKGFQGDEHDCAGTMAQLFDVAQEECSVIFLWTYLIAAVSLTVWSTIFMWILS